MSEYINRETVVAHITRMMRERFPGEEKQLDAVITVISEIPAADVEEKHVCGDCAWFYLWPGHTGYGQCIKGYKNHRYARTSDDYLRVTRTRRACKNHYEERHDGKE